MFVVKVPNETGAEHATNRIALRCPVCRREGTLDPLTGKDLRTREGYRLARRRCPAPDCGAVIFVIAGPDESIRATYPPELIDFDTEDVPERVVAAMEEAIANHANECYVSSAIMVRKTIEAMCEDKGAKGSDLMDRIEALGEIVTLPKEFLSGLHDLRLLGNDAAHVEARYYDDVGEEEAEAGIAVAKEFIRAVYQYDATMRALAALKRDESGLDG